MGEQNLGSDKLVQSKIIEQNPYAAIMQQLKNLIPLIQSELSILRKKHAQLQKNPSSGTHKQKPNNQSETNQPSTKATNLQSSDKQFKQIKQSIHLNQKHLQKIQLRLQLLTLGANLGMLSSPRLDQLEKIFNHYCHYIFKSGKHVTFDRIQYEKQHLIMERFFAFIHDFHLNKFHDPLKPPKELIPKHQLILVFKKSASNSRNLQFSEFITSLERFALLRYDYQETYDQRMQKEQRERRRIKEMNIKREKQRQRKRKQKQQQQERQKQKQQQLQKAAQQQQKRLKQEETQNQPNESQQPKQQTKQERKQRKKREKEKKKKKKPQKQENQNQSNTNQNLQDNKSDDPNIQQNENNDHILNQLMQKDNMLQNPNQQFNHLQKFKKVSQKDNSSNTQNLNDMKRKQVVTLSKQEKIQLLFRLIELDNPKAVQAKLRQYQKPLFKQFAQQRKSFILDANSSVTKLKQTDLKNQIRLGQLKSKLNDRKKEQFKLNVSRSITDQKYNQKRQNDYQKYLNKSLAASNYNLDSTRFQKYNLKAKNQDQTISLNILNQSSSRQLNNLKLGNLKIDIKAEDQDSIFLKQYGELGKIRSLNSSYISKTPRYSVDLKKRAIQMEEQQKKKEQQKLQRFALQMYKNQHYMKRFLQRKL